MPTASAPWRVPARGLRGEGLNAVDQLVGSFGPAMEEFSRYSKVKRDTGEDVGVAEALDKPRTGRRMAH